MPVFGIQTMKEMMSEGLAQQRFSLLLLGLFAALALLLASLGIYAVMAYSVQQSQREIGIRLALGAQPRDVLSLIVNQGMKLVGIGVVVGLLGAFGLTRLMSSLLFSVSATDPFSFVAITLLLSIVAFAACYIPARKAARVDPLIALRCE